MTLLIGCDPELFVKTKEGKFISGWGMVEGDKKRPLKVEKGAVQVDGMALEFNIDPAASFEEFVESVEAVKKQLSEMIGADKFELTADPSVFFDEDVWSMTPDEAKILGCEPDFNAWENGGANPRPDNSTTMRSGGGHVHVGWTDDADLTDFDHQAACMQATKQLDAALGLQSLLWDNNNDRRKLYGKAGAYRIKPYGMEYRVLSNAWVRNSALIGHVYKVTRKAMEDLMNGNPYYEFIGDKIRSVIDSNNTKEAAYLSNLLNKRFNVPVYEG